MYWMVMGKSGAADVSGCVLLSEHIDYKDGVVAGHVLQ